MSNNKIHDNVNGINGAQIREEKLKEVGREEGAICNRDGCQGIMEWEKNGSCSCHINPPCSVCTDAKLTCNECGEEGEDGE